MMFRLNSRAASQTLLKCMGQYQVPTVPVTTSAAKKSSERDLVNFPRPQRLENTPETRFAFLPKPWFDFLYPKTGVTGPYMLLAGISTYMFSKEIIVVSAEFGMLCTSISALMIINYKFGPKIRAFLEKSVKEHDEELNSVQNSKKEGIKENLEELNLQKMQFEGILQHLPAAKRENVYLQMEASYRARMQEAFTTVKKQLDYQVEKQNIERRIAQKNMVDYVIRNVQASVTPQLKVNALKQCINDLKKLSKA